FAAADDGARRAARPRGVHLHGGAAGRWPHRRARCRRTGRSVQCLARHGRQWPAAGGHLGLDDPVQARQRPHEGIAPPPAVPASAYNRRVPRILVLEDSQDTGDLLRHYLERAGHTVDLLTTGTAVLAHAREHKPDLVLLDLMLPGMDGLLVCQALRQDPGTAATPIIMVTARGEEADRIRGLELGADDYVVKPFSPKEVVARVAALLRRVERPDTPSSQLRHGPITMDLDRHEVRIDGTEVRLTAKEFLLLQYLIEHRGRVL